MIQKTHKKYNIAIAGATGNVGQELLKFIEERNFPVNNIYLYASKQSLGKTLSYKEHKIPILSLEDATFNEIDILFSCTNDNLAKQYIPKAIDKNCIVIDKSSHYRLDENVELIVPEANIANIKHLKNKKAFIISNPNCCVIPIVTALKPLDNAVKIKRIVISTYQSVSGAGKAAMDELYYQTRDKYSFRDIKKNDIFPEQIAFNLFPHIGNIREDGYTEEEYKIENELIKIIGNHISANVTCVRVPVFVSHSISANIEFNHDITVQEIEEILKESDGISVNGINDKLQYISPINAVQQDAVFVSRIRKDNSTRNAISLWISTDNLRKGAALNSLQIAEELIR
ncbi:aspartate-semialdehyde dehydrogenase [Rickettsia endosymbiont of Cardiosporidium cionae]|uniref:aspartate-semialdehyde dehydrogenase n=1 Tax=Rickettsia endosymbiont of Cardiosporidium cionae TaxID=2777155 RepID=UPI001893A4DA|nr:aspartate-semialdehyde dehydrogenase [Rickettsia endosymbiont of Cardiosporidium cionae]KAF8818604.1 aspartate-semialdehyde dehydrogenase [Rickettsia endosymbiont of Cardiosporidium cionae]